LFTFIKKEIRIDAIYCITDVQRLPVQGKDKWKGGIDMTVAASKYGSIHTPMFFFFYIWATLGANKKTLHVIHC